MEWLINRMLVEEKKNCITGTDNKECEIRIDRPRDVLKKVSRGLSQVEAGNPGFPRLVQVTSGGFSWWL